MVLWIDNASVLGCTELPVITSQSFQLIGLLENKQLFIFGTEI